MTAVGETYGTTSAQSDQQRFTATLEEFGPRVLAYLARRVNPTEDAADLLSEVMITAWRRVEDLPHGEQALPWLYAVARKTLSTHRRGQHRRTALVDRLRLHLTDTPSFDHGSSDSVHLALGKLRAADREILLLSVWEGLDADEIAEVLQLSSEAVRQRLSRARRRMRENWVAVS